VNSRHDSIKALASCHELEFGGNKRVKRDVDSIHSSRNKCIQLKKGTDKKFDKCARHPTTLTHSLSLACFFWVCERSPAQSAHALNTGGRMYVCVCACDSMRGHVCVCM